RYPRRETPVNHPSKKKRKINSLIRSPISQIHFLPTSGETKRASRLSSTRRPLPRPRRQHARRSALLPRRTVPNGDRLLRPVSPSPAPAAAFSARRPRPWPRRPPSSVTPFADGSAPTAEARVGRPASTLPCRPSGTSRPPAPSCSAARADGAHPHGAANREPVLELHGGQAHGQEAGSERVLSSGCRESTSSNFHQEAGNP
ncbi:unnamed protein product, partial [Urochloa humidicola]